MKAYQLLILAIIKAKDSGNGVSYKTLEMFSVPFDLLYDERESCLSSLIQNSFISENREKYTLSDRGVKAIDISLVELKSTLKTIVNDKSNATFDFLCKNGGFK